MRRIWVLGAPDPEMEYIESLLRQCREEVIYATDGDGRRVHPGNAYRCPTPSVPEGSTVYAVECLDIIPEGWVRIDHHRPGDPGYGRPPSEFMRASSIGQVISALARFGVLKKAVHHNLIPWNVNARNMNIDDYNREIVTLWFWTSKHMPSWPHSEPGMIEREVSWLFDGYAVEVGGRHFTDDDVALIPRHIMLAAAADHCLAAAYAGKCPGVDPYALMRWRVETRAAHQGRSPEDVLADVERARELLLEDPDTVELAPGIRVADVRGYCVVTHDCGSKELEHEDYMDHISHKHGCPGSPYEPRRWCNGWLVEAGVPELPEAAAREGMAYLATVTDRDGRRKVVLGGHTTPETVQAFMEHWAPRQGLVDIYGDPARGFAGGYLS